MKPPKTSTFFRGFTLIELAMVLFLVALLLGGILVPLSAQQDIRNSGNTQKILADARDALLGFAMAKDRLPCPASATSNGVESFCDDSAGPCVVTPPLQYQSHGRCSHPYNGFVPAVSLGLAPVDAQGYLLDGWGGDVANRVRYAVTIVPATNAATGNPIDHVFTTASGMKDAGMATLAPDLKICSTGVNMQNPGTATVACAAGMSLATDAVAVVYSLGKNAVTGGAGDDEKHNPNPSAAAVAADLAFVSAAQSTAFDDQIIWLSKNILLNRMVAGGRLP